MFETYHHLIKTLVPETRVIYYFVIMVAFRGACVE